MALDVPSFPNPFDPAHPIAPAYAWLSFLAVDLRADSGRITLSVHPNEGAWQAPPVSTIDVALGGQYGAKTFPRLDELMADPAFAAAFNAIGARLYAAAVATVPALSGATES